MSLRLHRLLNRVLPVAARDLGRSMALKSIPSMRHLDMPMRLKQLATLGVNPPVILDIGAASGDWARLAHGLWPAAKIFGFEPNEREVPALERTRADIPNFDFIRGFLGSEAKTVTYVDSHTQTTLFADGSAPAGPVVEAPMHVLDQLLSTGRIVQPQFVKLDVQGYELEVLRGGEQLLNGVEVVLMEVTFPRLVKGMPTIEEVLPFMLERGFAWYDIVSMLRRQEDDRLLQIDALFLRRGHALLNGAAE